ncbi:hypothetical protein CSV72_16200 [Sporosarcina sp. P20a]|nr:hypothetical protein CSV72_16200 [Sporosarcina sp. P20a]
MKEKLDRLTLMKKNLDQQRPLSKELSRSLKEDFIIKSTYHSNAIEGNRFKNGTCVRNKRECLNNHESFMHRYL